MTELENKIFEIAEIESNHSSSTRDWLYDLFKKVVDVTIKETKNWVEFNSSMYVLKAIQIIEKLLKAEENMYFECDGSDKTEYYTLRKQAQDFIKDMKTLKE